MKGDFLIELGTEELPPKALLPLSNAFTSGVVDGFKAANLDFGEVRSYAAPRRLAIVIKDLDTQTPDAEIVVWGPPIKVAFDADGQPTKAAQAFADKNGIELNQLSEHIDNDGQQDKLCVRRVEAGLPTSDLLAPVINQSLSALPIPKRMRWGSSKEEFVRPVQWAVLLFDGVVHKEQILGLTSGNSSRGHRFHSQGEVVIKSPDSYAEQLYQAKVIVDFAKRREIIRAGAIELAASINGEAVIDDDLLNEVSALNEWPVPLMGRFDDHFLAVPAQALISSMKEHQKYFHIVDANKQLLSAFITVANIESGDPAQVIDGNERVIRPRLADAAFFYNNDKKIRLDSRRESLKQVVFQAKLGSVFDKTERVAILAELIAPYTGAELTKARRAAELSKSDLVTDMVGEFDDLQGIMGRDYAHNDGEDNEVAEALYEQYLPRFAGDTVPTSATGTTLALADRLDSLVGIFSIGQQPSGSRDPFALRRASLGVLRILVERNIDMDLKVALASAANQFELAKDSTAAPDEICEQVLTYINDRFKSWYRDQGIAPEVYMAVAALHLSNPLDIDARVQAVNAFSQLPEASALAAANKRVANILTKQKYSDDAMAVQKQLLQESAEIALADSVENLTATIEPLLKQRDYNAVLQKLAHLRAPVDTFFDQVMVMADDPDIRNNRLALLFGLRQLFINVADISQLAPTK